MAPFETMFPTFLQKSAELHELLRIVAFMLFIVGTILFVLHGFTGKTLTLHMVRLFVLTALLVMLPRWGNEAQSLVQTSILNGLGVDPSNVQDQYNQLLVVKRDTGSDHSWWDILVSGYALSPLLIGFMAIPQLRSTGSRYLLNLFGVLLWPLGWAVAALITQGILDFMTDPSFKFIDPTAALYSLQATVGVVVVAFWIVFSTIAAPVVIQKVLTSGIIAGSHLLSGAASSLFQTAATTAGAAAVASTTGVPLATLGAAGMAAVLSTLSTAAGHGSAGAIIIAGSGLPPRSARGRPGDDITGDKSVRELIAKTKGHYY